MEEIMNESKKFETFDSGKTISARILVAEDNKITQDLVSDFLKFMGLEAALADNGILGKYYLKILKEGYSYADY